MTPTLVLTIYTTNKPTHTQQKRGGELGRSKGRHGRPEPQSNQHPAAHFSEEVMVTIRSAKKEARLRLLAEILRTQAISSQEELAAILLQRGHQRTQQLLHRDLSDVGAIKITYRGKTRWVLKNLDRWNARDGSGQCEQCAVAWYMAGIEDAERWGST